MYESAVHDLLRAILAKIEHDLDRAIGKNTIPGDDSYICFACEEALHIWLEQSVWKKFPVMHIVGKRLS